MDHVPIVVNLTKQLTHLCSMCHSPLKKNGTTSKGTQRWRCTHCGASTTHQRPDTARMNTLDSFAHWIVSKKSQAEHAGGTGRTFRHQISWCWTITPSIPVTAEVFTEIQVDDIYIRPGWCLLIAIAGGHAIAWQWCHTENSAAWHQLLRHLPEPLVVVTDGGSGLMKTLKTLWPKVRVQRCLVHVQRNVKNYLTQNPKTPAGRALRQISLKLTKVKTREEAEQWTALFNDWFTTYQAFINERTYAKDHRSPRPSWAPANRGWWFTHERLRRAYNSMKTVLQRGHMFTFADPQLLGLGISATTNMIEGAINLGIRAVIRYHRGMPVDHRRRAAEWFCWTRSDPKSRLSLPALIKAADEQQAARKARKLKIEHQHDEIGPQLYGTAAIAEEGLWTRAGRAGHTGQIHC